MAVGAVIVRDSLFLGLSMSGGAHLLSSRRLTFPNFFKSGTHSLLGEQREFFSNTWPESDFDPGTFCIEV